MNIPNNPDSIYLRLNHFQAQALESFLLFAADEEPQAYPLISEIASKLESDPDEVQGTLYDIHESLEEQLAIDIPE